MPLPSMVNEAHEGVHTRGPSGTRRGLALARAAIAAATAARVRQRDEAKEMSEQDNRPTLVSRGLDLDTSASRRTLVDPLIRHPGARTLGMRFVAVFLAAVIAQACVQVGVTPIVQPTLPAPDWALYAEANNRLAIVLPRAWQAVDLAAPDGVERSLAPLDPALATQLRPAISTLKQQGVRFFAFDPTTPVEQVTPRPFPALLYVNPAAATQQTLDALFASSPPEPTGRSQVDIRHLSGAAGDRIVRRVRETRIRPDGGTEVSIQYTVALVRGGFLHLLVIQVPGSAAALYESQLDMIASSFSPY